MHILMKQQKHWSTLLSFSHRFVCTIWMSSFKFHFISTQIMYISQKYIRQMETFHYQHQRNLCGTFLSRVSRKRLIRYHKTILQTTTVFGLWFWSLLALLKFITTVQYTNALKVFTVFWVSQEAYENKEFPRKKRQMRATSYSVQVMHPLNEVNLLVVIHINEPLLTQSPWCNN